MPESNICTAIAVRTNPIRRSSALIPCFPKSRANQSDDKSSRVLIAQAIPQRMIRVMRATDGVKVVLLHQLDITAHRRFIHYLPVFRMMLMAVYAPNQQRFTVELQQAIADFNPAKADVACLDVQHITLCVPKRNCQPVKFRRFRTPQCGIFDGDRHR